MIGLNTELSFQQLRALANEWEAIYQFLSNTFSKDKNEEHNFTDVKKYLLRKLEEAEDFPDYVRSIPNDDNIELTFRQLRELVDEWKQLYIFLKQLRPKFEAVEFTEAKEYLLQKLKYSEDFKRRGE